jgi:single-strand DNA-binding protein
MSARVTLLGTVGRDPEQKVSSKGVGYAKFSVATRTGKKDKDGNWMPDRWWDVMVFGPLAEQISGYVVRGSYVEVEGKFEFEDYKKQDGSIGQSFKCLADRIEQKEKPAGKVHTSQFPPEIVPKWTERELELAKTVQNKGKDYEQSIAPVNTSEDRLGRNVDNRPSSSSFFDTIPF